MRLRRVRSQGCGRVELTERVCVPILGRTHLTEVEPGVEVIGLREKDLLVRSGRFVEPAVAMMDQGFLEIARQRVRHEYDVRLNSLFK